MIYIRGSVLGNAGDAVFLRDTKKELTKNHKYLNFPTFIPLPGVEYADQMIMRAPLEDPFEQYLNDNTVPEDKDGGGGGDDWEI